MRSRYLRRLAPTRLLCLALALVSAGLVVVALVRRSGPAPRELLGQSVFDGEHKGAGDSEVPHESFKPSGKGPAQNAALPDSEKEAVRPAAACGNQTVVYPSWPDGFDPGVNAIFIIGEQKSGSTWLWELLNGHPCLHTAVQPHWSMGAITTKETYYFTSLRIEEDARQFLVPWLGHNQSFAQSPDAWQHIAEGWFRHALAVADRGIATTSADFWALRSFTQPGRKLPMRETCNQHFLLEATPHNLHTPIAAARIKQLFPDAKVIAILKEPVWRMASAYNQFSKVFLQACRVDKPASWCPVFRYYQLRLPTFAEALEQEIAYVRGQGCTFQHPDQQARSWMDCFGCAVMDPWRHKRDGINLMHPPFAPSAALSMYAPMLEEWLRVFDNTSVRVLNYEDAVNHPLETANTLLRFAGLEEYTPAHLEILQPSRLGFRGRSGSAALSDQEREARAQAAAFFEPLNKQLSELLANYGLPWVPFS